MGPLTTSHSYSQITRLNDLSYDIKIWTDLSSFFSQPTRLTDGQRDSFLVARPRLQSMQRSKKSHEDLKQFVESPRI